MDSLIATMWPPTAWHWLALGLLLLSIEMMIGTFDLLWIAIAAALTSVFTAIAPDSISIWQGQLTVFAIASVAMFIAGRTVFSKMRQSADEHPTLNKRMVSTVGARAIVTADFVGGMGRVKLGDTRWSAQSLDGEDLKAGTAVIVEATEGNALKVRVI